MKKIVYIEDDPDIRELVKIALQVEGFEVLAAPDGVSGLQLVRAEQPDIVLLDLMVPRMHGFTVCEEMRKDVLLQHVPILIISAKSYPVDVKKAAELGANGYLNKPFAPEELLAKVREALDSSRVRVKFWGTRGSIATPGNRTVRYGGNTSCVEIRHAQTILLLDCGTGAREAGLAMGQEFRGRPMHVHLFISHTHWDHIQGFPFFAPAYTPGNSLTLYSVHGTDKSLTRAFSGQMDASYFPVSLGDLNANVAFQELEGDVQAGSAAVSHAYLNHPGVAIGFRIRIGGKLLAYVTDHEPYCRMSGENEHNRKRDREITDFVRGADLYIREAQYTEEEYSGRRGWGHSTFGDALRCATEADVRSLALYHHDPMHDDPAMDQIRSHCEASIKNLHAGFSFDIASDNLEVVL